MAFFCSLPERVCPGSRLVEVSQVVGCAAQPETVPWVVRLQLDGLPAGGDGFVRGV